MEAKKAKQHRHCRYDKTLRRIRVTILRWNSIKYYIFWECVSSHSYPACERHPPYCHLWPVRLYHIFPHYLTKGTIFGKKDIGHKMCVLIFSTTSAWNSLILRRIERDIIINMFRSTCKVPLFFQMLMKLEFSRQIFEKCSDIKFHENPSSWRWAIPHGRTDRNITKLSCRFPQFCEPSPFLKG